MRRIRIVAQAKQFYTSKQFSAYRRAESALITASHTGAVYGYLPLSAYTQILITDYK